MRASAEDGEAAALMGIRQGQVSALAWVVAGVLAAVAALFLVGSPTGVTPAAYAVGLRAFPAAILGGLDSVGAPWSAAADRDRRGPRRRLPGPAAVPGRGFGAVVPFIVMIAVLMFRPSGLFGTKELTRV